MYEATFELEAITPVFMRGADQRKAEFRSASVKGVMRWWFRALAGNYFGNDIKGLKRAECRVFGCAGEETRRSAVTVEVESLSEPRDIYFTRRRFDRDSWIWDLQYLFFSIKLTAGKQMMNKFYPPGSKFRVTLSSYSEDLLKAAVASLWTGVMLGGFGFRARRGAGSLKFAGDTRYLGELGLVTSPNSDKELGDSINRAVKLVGDSIGVSSRVKGIFKYPVLGEESSCVARWGWETDPKGLLKSFQGKYSRFRSSPSLRVKRVVLGLPIVKGKLGPVRKAAKNARRASPLIVTVLPYKGAYSLVLTKLRTGPYYTAEKRELKGFENTINKNADWKVLHWLDVDHLSQEVVVYGSPEVFLQ
ncbi:type III-B CRISPR module RAMP protein Cmr1 [Thermococcus sp. JdF3]|uniref:type III-B CRISPR module RAMP protein Cmr1 n=1 Tax=Thermococcus sp. JdF3 TaxID=1638258 RepID=UPI001438C35B|nr:type III-B CRISPR module RAMP protein Cmr1 [Thermococcus sp. JdF3]